MTDAERSARSRYRAVERGELDLLHAGVNRFHESERTLAQTVHAAVWRLAVA